MEKDDPPAFNPNLLPIDIEMIPDCIFIADNRGRFINANQKALDLLGYRLEELADRRIEDIIHPDDLARQPIDYEGLKAGKTVQVERRFRRKDASYLFIEINAKIIEGERLMGVVRDLSDRKKAEEAVRKSESQLSLILNNASDVIFAIVVEPPDGFRFSWVNRRFYEVTGLTESQVVGVLVRDVIPKPAHALVFSKYRAAIQSGRPVYWEEVSEYPSGKKYGHVTVVPVFEDHRTCSQLIGMVHDITARRLSEERLRESERKYRELVENANSIILRWTPEGHLTFLNEFGQRFFGYSTPEILGRHVMDTIVPPIESGGRDLSRLMEQICANPKSFEQNVNENMRRNGERVWISWTNKIVMDPQGRVAEILSIGTDITAKRKAEKALRESEERFRGIFEKSPIGIGLLELDSTIVVSNPRFTEMSGYSPKELAGRSCHSITHPEDIEVDVKFLKQMANGEISHYGTEKRYLRKDGSVLWGYLIGTLLRDEAGKPLYLLAMIEDLTARKEAEQKAQKYQRLAVLGEMAAGLAHEIRNPTAAISAQAQYLLKKMGKESRAYRSQLQDVLVQCERLETLIRDTLDYSPQKKFEEREEVQAKALLNKALKLAQTQFGPDHGRMKVKLKFGLRLPILSIHPGRMERVLVNLILNAFQAMPQGGLLTLEAKRIKNKIALRVEDNGKGLAGVEIAKLFEPFYTSRKTGSGLGLAICQKIVEEHGGEIRAEKRKPKGAAFIVELPLRDGDGA